MQGLIEKRHIHSGLPGIMVIGLVHHHHGVGRKLANKAFQIFSRSNGRGGIVRVADVNQSSRGTGSRQHTPGIVDETGGKRYRYHFGARGLAVVLDGFERRCGLDQLPPAAQKGTHGNAKDFSRSTSEQHLLRPHLVDTRDLLGHFVVLSKRIAVHQADSGTDGFSHFGGRTIGILIAVQPDESARLRRPRRLRSVSSRNCPEWPTHGGSRGGSQAQGAEEVSARTRHADLLQRFLFLKGLMAVPYLDSSSKRVQNTLSRSSCCKYTP